MKNPSKKTTDAFKVTGNWKNQSSELQRKFSQLTNDDLKFVKGQEDELLKRIENRLDKPRHEVVDIIQNNLKPNARQ